MSRAVPGPARVSYSPRASESVRRTSGLPDPTEGKDMKLKPFEDRNVRLRKLRNRVLGIVLIAVVIVLLVMNR